MTGVIKSFSRQHGYGFIETDREANIFFHVKDWIGNGKPSIGQRVEFMWVESEKGLRAIRIRGIR